MKIDRLLAIIIMLLNRNRVQARDLADHFEVSTRTIYRDIETINNAGIPIVTHQGKNGGLAIIDSYKLDRQVLTLKDMVAMLSVLKGVNSTFNDRQITQAIEKIHALVPENKQNYVKNHLDRVVIDIMPWGSSPRQQEKMVTLQQAIANNILCNITYQDSNGAVSQRKIEPMTLVFKSTAWYLFAYCTMREDFRIFKVGRVVRLAMLAETFRRKNVSWSQYDTMDTGSTKMIGLVIRFSKKIRHIVEEYFEHSQLEDLPSGDMIATFELPNNDWIISYLLSLGDDAELLEPKYLRTILQKKAEKISNLYKHDIQVS